MADPLRPLRINAVELLRQPGADRVVACEVNALALGVGHERLVDGDDTVIEIDLQLLATNDSIDVAGVIAVESTGACRRCLTPVNGRSAATVDERYQVQLTDPDAFEIENGQLDLTSMAREVMLLELDDEVLCRPDCAGLCPVCGVDRNDGPCNCDTTVRDERWAALDQLRLDD